MTAVPWQGTLAERITARLRRHAAHRARRVFLRQLKRRDRQAWLDYP